MLANTPAIQGAFNDNALKHFGVIFTRYIIYIISQFLQSFNVNDALSIIHKDLKAYCVTVNITLYKF